MVSVAATMGILTFTLLTWYEILAWNAKLDK